MKQVFKVAVLLGALLGYGLGAPVHAATDAKKPPAVAKKSGSKDVAVGKTAAVPASKSGAAKTAKAPGKSTAAGKAPVKSASRAASQKTASEQGAKKSMRKVSMADVDPRRLMLYSASALASVGIPIPRLTYMPSSSSLAILFAIPNLSSPIVSQGFYWFILLFCRIFCCK